MTPDLTNADDNLQKYKKDRDTHIAALSDRVRTMSLGSLVFIWGLLTAAGKDAVHLELWQKFCCCALAFLAVAVLALDLVEYLMGMRGYQELAGDVVPTKINYFRRQRTMRGAKLWTGLMTLLGLCGLGASIIGYQVVTVHAQSLPKPSDFYGLWCGPNADATSYFCLDLSSDVFPQQLVLNISIGTKKGSCREPHFEGQRKSLKLVSSYCELKPALGSTGRTEAVTIGATEDGARLQVDVSSGGTTLRYYVKKPPN